MVVPNFFIVGAQKCGTTALYHYLKQHPAIFMCEPKEPEFFATDFPRFRHVTEISDYIALFRHADERHVAVGEASTIYIYSSTAVAELLGRFPRARLIAMLRNPIELAPAAHAQSLRDGDEDVESFEDAWSLCGERARGRNVPSECRDNKILLYDKIGCLGFQLQRLLERVSTDRLKCVFLEDLKARPAETYREVVEFLSIHDGFCPDFSRENARKEWRSHRVAWMARRISRITNHPPKWLFRARDAMGLRRIGVMGIVDRLNTKQATAREVGAATKRKMLETFRTDVLLLQHLTGRNLGHWLT